MGTNPEPSIYGESAGVLIESAVGPHEHGCITLIITPIAP